MRSYLINVFVLFCVGPFLAFGAVQGSRRRSGQLLVILLDGFRWDYLNYDVFGNDGLRRLIREGTAVEYLQPVYPSDSYPNYYSLMTGLYAESHGIVGNYMYDFTRNESFLVGLNPEQYNAHWWNDGDPIWVTATRQKKKCYMFHWLGCEVEIRGIRPEFCEKYKGIPTMQEFRSAISQSVGLLANDSADMAAIFFGDVDHYGHATGPSSDVLKTTLSEVDEAIAFLLAELDRRHIRDTVDVIIASDHGMSDISNISPPGIINISKVLSPDEFTAIMDLGSKSSIYTRNELVPKVYKKLKSFHPHMKVYLKHEIPDRWHYKGGRLVPQITVVADLGWFIVTPTHPHFPTVKDGRPFQGWHGYDNILSDMHGIFLATGPSFKRNHAAGPLEITQLYQVMCKILDVTPSPNNGSWSHVEDFVRLPLSSALGTESGITLILLIVMVTFMHM